MSRAAMRSRCRSMAASPPETAPRCIAAGADMLVAGTAVFGAPDYAAAIAALRGEGPADDAASPSRWLRDARRALAACRPCGEPGAGRAGAVVARPLARRCRPRRPAAARRTRGAAAAFPPLRPGDGWDDAAGPLIWRAAAHGFTWLRDLRALGHRRRPACAPATWCRGLAGPRRGRDAGPPAPTSPPPGSPPGSATRISSPPPPRTRSASG